MSPAGVGSWTGGNEVSRGRFKWGRQGLTQDYPREVRERGQWMAEKKLVRNDPQASPCQPA